MKIPSSSLHASIIFGVVLLVLSDQADVGNASTMTRPNIIILQPDDMEFFEEWKPPPHHPNDDDRFIFPSSGLPNIEILRRDGVQMMQAYTPSPLCSTSRYSTITGRYPSRSSYNREMNLQFDVADVVVTTTKLEDVDEPVQDGYDCRDHNLAALLRQNGYRTGVVGKWHLQGVSRQETFNYPEFRRQVRDCGFDFAEALYAENLNGFWTDGTFSHNMEYVADQAIEFIRNATNEGKPFFLYLNPTVPHRAGDIWSALNVYKCTDTPAGKLESEPVIPGMTDGRGCEAYRRSILDRANGDTSNNNLGSIWMDDAIGSILTVLMNTRQLENTFFLFQMDHGQEGKATLWEPGIRLAQFVFFPSHIPSGTLFNGMVSTIDIGPTILDYAGIDETSPGYYEMDGLSWRDAVNRSIDADAWNENRCLFFEVDQDRAVRCGCYKYLQLESLRSSTARRGRRQGLAVGSPNILLDLCNDPGDEYDTVINRETVDVSGSNPEVYEELRILTDCHLRRTSPSENPDYDTECGLAPPVNTPTSDPTTTPPPTTSSPTDFPTSFPTTSPTTFPTVTPSFSPTSPTPSTPPSSVPSQFPSDSPSDIPTTMPSSVPSVFPSTTAPTASPVPSAPPSTVPSAIPSDMPSERPSQIPSSTPSFYPSTSAPTSSAVPSTPPSSVPSEMPSQVPSYEPSFMPSSVPSSFPSTPAPTVSVVPSTEPSDIPSALPSEVPSDPPSQIPSSVPSEYPSTTAPTASPEPSGPPSAVRSEIPSEIPSELPSEPPSQIPSFLSSFYPSTTDEPTTN